MEAGVIELQKENARSTVDTTLSARQFYQQDPLLVLLKEKLHLNNFWTSVGTTLFLGSVYLIWWLLSEARVLPPWHLNDVLSVIIQTFVLFPFLFFSYTFIPSSIAKLFNALYLEGVIGTHRKDRAERETYARFTQQLVSWIDNRWWTVAVTGVIILYICSRLLFLQKTLPSYLSLLFIMRFIVLIPYLPLMFAIGMNVIRLVLTLTFINRLFYLFTLQIKPLHADGSGGLGSLKPLLWLCVSMMLWLAFLLVAAILSNTLLGLSFTEKFMLVATYIILIPALLIGWWIYPHRMMIQARDEVLQPLVREYQQTLLQSLPLETQETQSIVAETLRLETLKKRYDLIYASFPVWPLNISTLSRVGVTVILPVILPLIFPSAILFLSSVAGRIGL